jgi:hypothetical protein
VAFHGFDIGILKMDLVFVPDARWKIPVTYTIVEVLDFVFVETTLLFEGRKVYENLIAKIRMLFGGLYECGSKYHTNEIGQFRSCPHTCVDIFLLRKLIDTDDSFILLIQCPNRPENYSKSLERPDDTL